MKHFSAGRNVRKESDTEVAMAKRLGRTWQEQTLDMHDVFVTSDGWHRSKG